MTYFDVFVRLGAAVGTGALIGLDRELRRKPAGLRTMALVGLGSAVFILATIDPAGGAYSDSTARVVQGIVTGIGFLGAGAIIRGTADDTVRGLTTAASTWLAAATGIACGLANWPLVVGSMTLGMLVLYYEPCRGPSQSPKDRSAGPPAVTHDIRFRRDSLTSVTLGSRTAIPTHTNKGVRPLYAR